MHACAVGEPECGSEHVSSMRSFAARAAACCLRPATSQRAPPLPLPTPAQTVRMAAPRNRNAQDAQDGEEP